MAESTSFEPWTAADEIRQDLSKEMEVVGYTMTKLYSKLQSTVAKNKIHQWESYDYAAAADNAVVYSSDFSYSKETAATLNSAYVQLFAKTLEVDDLLQRFDTAGFEDEVADRMQVKVKELLNDVEYALFTGTGNAGATGTAPRIKGCVSWISTNNGTGTGTGTEYLTETMLNDQLANCAAYGGTGPYVAYCNAFQKSKISAFATSNTRYLDVKDGSKYTIAGRVDVYESNFGTVEIDYTPRIATDTVAILDISMWAKAIGLPAEMIDAAKTSHSTKKVVRTALALVSKGEKRSAKITGLKTS